MSIQIVSTRAAEVGRIIDLLYTAQDGKVYAFRELLTDAQADPAVYYAVAKRLSAFERRILQEGAQPLTLQESRVREDIEMLDALLDALDADIDSNVAALQAGKDAVRNAVWTPLTNAQKIELLRDSVALLFDIALFLTRALRTMRRVGRVVMRLAKVVLQ